MLRSIMQSTLQHVRWQVHPGVCWSFSRSLKATTGIVGLPVDPEARKHLKERLERILDDIKIIPEGVLYRTSVEEFIQERLQDVNSSMTDEELEDKYKAQLEQQIKMCDDEIGLIPKMAEWKPWECPPDHKLHVIATEADVQKFMDQVNPKVKGAESTDPPGA